MLVDWPLHKDRVLCRGNFNPDRILTKHSLDVPVVYIG